jgi:hypothetical protein
MRRAAPEVHDAARLLDQWAATTNVVAKDTRGVRTYFTGKINLLTLNPTLAHLQFNFEALRQTHRTADADAIQSLLSRITGSQCRSYTPPCRVRCSWKPGSRSAARSFPHILTRASRQ